MASWPGLLGEEEREDGGGGSVDMVERYRKSDMCQRAEQELGEVWQRLEERGQGGRLPAAGYASNILWQVTIVFPLLTLISAALRSVV